LIRIDSPPGWFGEEGWHLTSETLNMSERLAKREAVAYVKSRPDLDTLLQALNKLPVEKKYKDRFLVRQGQNSSLKADAALGNLLCFHKSPQKKAIHRWRGGRQGYATWFPPPSMYP